MTKTWRLSAAVLILGLCVRTAKVDAAEQSAAPEKALTTAELRAKVATLEQDLANLSRDYRLLLTTTYHNQQRPVATHTDEAVERARLAERERVRLEAAQREYDLEEERRVESTLFYIQDVRFGVTERNSVYERFGWKATVRNMRLRHVTYDIEVQFLDDRGLVVDTGRLYRQVIGAYDAQTLHGSVLISVPAASRVTQVNVVAVRH